jgi:hypothetical protein
MRKAEIVRSLGLRKYKVYHFFVFYEKFLFPLFVPSLKCYGSPKPVTQLCCQSHHYHYWLYFTPIFTTLLSIGQLLIRSSGGVRKLTKKAPLISFSRIWSTLYGLVSHVQHGSHAEHTRHNIIILTINIEIEKRKLKMEIKEILGVYFNLFCNS